MCVFLCVRACAGESVRREEEVTGICYWYWTELFFSVFRF